MQPKTRDIIIGAAIPLFARNGIDGVTVREIARESGVMLGSITHFFPHKTDLYQAAVTEASRYSAERIFEVLSIEGPPRVRFARVCRTVFAEFTGGDARFRLVDRANFTDEYARHPATIAPPFQDAHRHMAILLRELGVDAGSEVRLEWYISIVFSLCYGAAKLHGQHRTLLDLGESGTDAFIETIVRFALDGLAAASAEPAGRRG